VSEFLADRAARATILRGRCLPYGEGITYWPVGEIVRLATGASEDDDAAIGERIRGVMGTDANADQIGDLLASMLGVSTVNAPPQERFWAVRRFLEAQARAQPLICLVEDIHWAEPEMLDLLENVADLSRDAPILLLCTARPELLEARPTWGGGKVNATTILLEPLNAEATRQLVTALMGQDAEARLVERILATAEGNPLFAEEIVRMLGDDAAQTADEQVQIPTSVQAVIAARLDRLPASERIVAETASVCGRVFERGAVVELVRELQREGVPGALLGLTRKELVQPSQPDLTADEAFRFRHMLIRDTAYEGLPKEERAALHERFAGWVERVAGDRLDEYREILGYHLEHAALYRRELGLDDGHAAELAERAGEQLRAAGTRAYLRGEDVAAVKLLDRAVQMLPPGPSRRSTLVSLSQAGDVAERARSSLEIADRLAVEARAAGDEVGVLKAAVLTIVPSSLFNPDYTPSDHLAELAAAVTEFERVGDIQGLAIAAGALAAIYLGVAKWERSGEAARGGLAYAVEIGDLPMADRFRFLIANAALWGPTPVPEILRLMNDLLGTISSMSVRATLVGARGLAHAMAGDASLARADIAEGMRIKRELGDPQLAWLFQAPPVEIILGDFGAAEIELQHAIRVLERLGETGQRSTMFGFRARNSFDLGRPESEIAAYADECRRLASADDMVSQLQWRAALALVAAREGRIDEARQRVEDAAAFIAEGGSDFQYEIALTAQDRGYVHAMAGELDEARRAYQEALERFEEKGDVMDAARVREKLAELGGG
jgi:tetratricopeptide (TPR) repeat protein